MALKCVFDTYGTAVHHAWKSELEWAMKLTVQRYVFPYVFHCYEPQKRSIEFNEHPHVCDAEQKLQTTHQQTELLVAL